MAEKGNGFRSASELPPPVTTAQVDIPVLRKEEKERKGVGVLMPSAAVAKALPGGLGGLSAASSKLVLGALALAVAGGGYAGYQRFGAAGSQRAPRASTQDLAPIESTIVVQKRNSDGSRSLNFASHAGGGDLRWDDPAQAAALAAAKASAEAKAAAEPSSKADAVADDEEAVEEEEPKEGKLGRPSGSQLSSDLGGSRSAAFGKRDIFGGGGGLPAKGMSASPSIHFAGKDFTARGSRGSQLGGLGKGMKALKGNKKLAGKITASRAMGQLKFSGRSSRNAASSQTGEGGSQMAAAAFEQASATGGQLQDGGAGGAFGDALPAIQPGSAGAPDMTGTGTGEGQAQACPSGWTTNADGSCTPPNVGPAGNVTPYQGQLEAAKAMADMARNFFRLALLFGILALATIAWPPIAAIFAALAVIFLIIATDISEQAKSMGDNVIGSQYGQQAQGNIVDRCADKSNEAETHQCEPTATAIRQEEIDPKAQNTASEDAQAEGSATYNEGGQ